MFGKLPQSVYRQKLTGIESLLRSRVLLIRHLHL